MKHLRLTFEDKDFEILKIQKADKTWHDFIMTLGSQANVLSSGMVEIQAICPQCGRKQRVALSQIVARSLCLLGQDVDSEAEG